MGWLWSTKHFMLALVFSSNWQNSRQFKVESVRTLNRSLQCFYLINIFYFWWMRSERKKNKLRQLRNIKDCWIKEQNAIKFKLMKKPNASLPMNFYSQRKWGFPTNFDYFIPTTDHWFFKRTMNFVRSNIRSLKINFLIPISLQSDSDYTIRLQRYRD